MRTYWKDYKGDDEHFWQHEWGKHGTCVSTLARQCYSNYQIAQEVPDYFERAVSLFKSLPTYDWLRQAGIEPSLDRTYTFEEIETALSSQFENRQVRLGCHNGQLNEVWYFYNVRGALQSGVFVPTDRVGSPSSCPRIGIQYLPKHGNRPSTSTTSRGYRPTNPPGSPERAFKGRGQLNVILEGNIHGCIISKGGWYASGTCATFVASRKDDKISLRSSKGPCAVVDGVFLCDRRATLGAFEADGRMLSFNRTTTFSAQRSAHGRNIEKVYVGEDHEINIQIAWA